MVNTDTPHEKMITKLTRTLDESEVEFTRWQRYADGKVMLEFVAPEIKKATQDRLQTLSVPWARLLISAIEERLTITGFRTKRDGPLLDQLWKIWQRANLDEGSQLAHAEALTLGRSFVLVWADDQGRPVITVESARNCAVIHDPATRQRVAGMKRWVADDLGHLVLFLPDRVVRFVSAGNVVVPETLPGATWNHAQTWPNPLGVVPLIPLINKPSLLDMKGRSELADLLPLLDALTKVSTDAMVASESHAGPRRYATGLILEEDSDEDTGQPTGDISTGHGFSDLPGRLWVAEDPQAKFGQFPGSDLAGFANMLGVLKRDLGAVAGLPPHYLGMHSDQPSSADAIRSAEASLVATVKRKALSFSGSWEESMRLAHAIEVGYFDPSLDDLETVWADFETRTIAQATDAAAKAVGANILDPDFAAELFLGMTPTQVARNRGLRRGRAIETTAPQLLIGGE